MNENELIKELTTLLFIYRKKKKYTLKQLAELIGCDAKLIRKIELAEANVSLSNYFKIAGQLNIPLNELVKVLGRYYHD